MSSAEVNQSLPSGSPELPIAERLAAIHRYDERNRQENRRLNENLPFMQPRIGAVAGIETLNIIPARPDDESQQLELN